VKVGHKQVVGLIRQGGNRLVMKVVSVTRKPEEDGARRRGEGSDGWAFRPLTSSPHSSSISDPTQLTSHCCLR
jgi:SH3/ankyrin repeat-containing protein